MTIDKPITKLRDWRGTPIVAGVTIIYPGRQSSSMWMVEAEVLSIVTIEHWGHQQTGLRVLPVRQGTYGRTSMKPVNLTALERVTVITECKPSNQSPVRSTADELIVDALIGRGE